MSICKRKQDSFNTNNIDKNIVEKSFNNHSTWIFHCYKVSVDHCIEGSEKKKGKITNETLVFI